MSTSSAHFSAPPPFAKTITTKLSLTLGRPIISTHHHLLLPFILPLLILSLLFLSLPSPALCQQPSPSPPSPPPSPPSSPPASASRQQHRQQERSLGSSGGGKETLYIAGFFPTSRDKVEGATGRGVLPAVKLALQHVNESPLFTKYRLDLVWNDTKNLKH
ncbi:Gamma-aminobutyric acid type B receptor subunit 2 [Tyrophagus putrescentiae]|nr:Gamma-aminobutyric acid type B receptor subunit 2 [Tyrophagus putrescentiae]